MKTILSTSLFFLLILISKAQDLNLPQGKLDIQLHSGKTIKRVLLWKIDTLKVEYVKDGNLGDVKTEEVKKIETSKYIITFDNEHQMIKRQYDLIVIYYQDTIPCILELITKETITYTPAGKTGKTTIQNAYVQKYLQRKNNPEVLDEWESPETKKQAQKIVSHENPNIISAADIAQTTYENTKPVLSIPRVLGIAPDDRRHYRNDDLIITEKGDSIRCTVDRMSSSTIYYHYKRCGPDPRGKIKRAEVLKIATPPFGFKNKRQMETNKAGGVIFGVAAVALFIGIVAMGQH